MNKIKYKIAIITPPKLDYMAETIIDGIIQSGHDFRLSSGYPSEYEVGDHVLNRKEFTTYAENADLILLMWGKSSTDFNLADTINQWHKTIFIDGSELGKDRRYDKNIQNMVLSGEWVDNGKIDQEMLKKSALYFRRERPYINGIIPLPYGIESKYVKFDENIKKDIDFVCIFGQEEFPVLRREVREFLEKYCSGGGFICHTKRTKNQEEFYKLLARAKVGISVGGGGFDTARFWEILANNCLLLTESIEIYEPSSRELDFKRIRQFEDFGSFKSELDKISKFITTEYNQKYLEEEYRLILEKHSSKSRVETILNNAKLKGLI